MHLRVRKLNLDIFTGNILSQDLIITPQLEGDDSGNPSEAGAFFENIFPLQKGQGGEETMIILRPYLEYLSRTTLGWNRLTW